MGPTQLHTQWMGVVTVLSLRVKRLERDVNHLYLQPSLRMRGATLSVFHTTSYRAQWLFHFCLYQEIHAGTSEL